MRPLLLAYFDPGTGSLVLQVVLGTLLTGWVVFKQFFGRFRFWGKKESADAAPPDDAKAE